MTGLSECTEGHTPCGAPCVAPPSVAANDSTRESLTPSGASANKSPARRGARASIARAQSRTRRVMPRLTTQAHNGLSAAISCPLRGRRRGLPDGGRRDHIGAQLVQIQLPFEGNATVAPQTDAWLSNFAQARHYSGASESPNNRLCLGIGGRLAWPNRGMRRACHSATIALPYCVGNRLRDVAAT